MMYDIRAYNEGLRWDKLPQSAIRIPPAERDAFLDEREQLQDELRIDDFDITRLKTEGETKDRADVQIRWVWHMDREGIVKETTSKQSWKRHGSRWLMLHEVFVRGDEMPGLAEADEEDEGEGEDASETETDEDASEDDGPVEEALVEPQTGARRAAYHEVFGALQMAEKPHRIAE
tara:strand:- start:290205 stop:290732 length:528 start_codon:yes stop_codon:yes gene_type:complete